MTIVHRGRNYRRTQDHHNGINREKVFSKAWEEANNPPSFVNRGIGALAWTTTGEPNCPKPEDLTQRDAEVAASVVQWLGSSVGHCWLSDTLAKCGYAVIWKGAPK